MEIRILEINGKEKSIGYYRSNLMPYAYNILGDSMAAEDIVQEVLNHYFLNPRPDIEKPYSYLVKAVINKSINQKKLLRTQRELYPGQWLPTPVFTEEHVYSKIDRHKVVNYSLLVLLEKLNPKERAVFILKETFDYAHAEIALILDIEIEHSRQLLKRAREKLGLRSGRSFISKNSNPRFLKQLTEAILDADVERVKSLLSEDVQALSDGGPKVAASRNILYGFDRVSKLMKAIYSKYLLEATELEYLWINHNPAILYTSGGKVYRCIICEIPDQKIEKVYIIVNPDKLEELNLHAHRK